MSLLLLFLYVSVVYLHALLHKKEHKTTSTKTKSQNKYQPLFAHGKKITPKSQ